ncbi:MAG TPA: arylsulfatase [Iamia sp.]|nr:arylsulfatase [Iamia sp.]
MAIVQTDQFPLAPDVATLQSVMEQIVEPGFGGVIGPTVSESVPWWPAPTERGDRPNVVVIVLDDVGFAQLGCYGSDIDTPHSDALAAEGVRLSNLHVTPLCSPTRACLLTGRNHHTVGMSMITGFPSGFPNGREQVTDRAAMLPAHLRAAGYGTYAVGKWHLGPMHEINPAGPFDHWPLAHGFDRFYGFLAGETDQFRPNLVQDNGFLERPPGPGYHLSEDLTDKAIEMVASHRSGAPHRPFFLYLAYGACHGPHQVPDAYLDTHRGRYDDGWDVVRERWYRRQLELGVIPPGTKLPPSNPGVPAWDDVPVADRDLFVRYQELFAAFLHHTDAQIGRLLAALERLDARDDTIVVLVSDNGAAGEGGQGGAWNELLSLNGIATGADDSRAHLDVLGGPDSYPIYPTAWAQVGNTPCKWYKHHTFGGGVRAPMIVNWPQALTRRGEVEGGFAHAVDLVPTLLEACRVEPAPVVGGVEQLPIAGTSFLGRLLGEDSGPTPPRTQYFEMGGHRGIYHDGWKATTMHASGTPFAEDRWELYHLDQDFSEHDDLADAEPDRLRRMVDLWWAEAGRYGVAPLDDRFLERALSRQGHPDHGVTRFVLYRGTRRISEAAAPELHGGPFRIRVDVRDLAPDHEGVLLAYGGRFAGFALRVRSGRLELLHRGLDGSTRSTVTGPLTVGDHELGLDWEPDGMTEAAVALVVDGVTTARGRVESVAPYYAGGNGIEVGSNRLSPIDGSDGTSTDFTGDFRTVTIELASEPVAPTIERALAAD